MEIFKDSVDEDSPVGLVILPTEKTEQDDLSRLQLEDVIAVRVYTADSVLMFRKKGVTADEIFRAIAGKSVTEVLTQ